MRSDLTNTSVVSSYEYCADCDLDYAVEMVTERVTADTVTCAWTCPVGHFHEYEKE
jgi:hypothetical protein